MPPFSSYDLDIFLWFFLARDIFFCKVILLRCYDDIWNVCE